MEKEPSGPTATFYVLFVDQILCVLGDIQTNVGPESSALDLVKIQTTSDGGPWYSEGPQHIPNVHVK